MPVYMTMVIVFSGGESLCVGGENACIHDTGHCVFRGRMCMKGACRHSIFRGGWGGENLCVCEGRMPVCMKMVTMFSGGQCLCI